MRILIISSYAGIKETINSLFQKDFAEVDDWAPVQPAVNYPGELVTILVRYRIRQEGDSRSAIAKRIRAAQRSFTRIGTVTVNSSNASC